MSLVTYQQSRKLSQDDPSFYALIMAAMRKGDSNNLGMLKACWPEVWTELQARYNAPGGMLSCHLCVNGYIACSDPQCGDSTWDHNCNERGCPCKGEGS